MAGLHRRAWWRCGVAACGTLATVNAHYRLFYEAADAAGIKKSVTLHTLRHLRYPPARGQKPYGGMIAQSSNRPGCWLNLGCPLC